MPRFSDPLSRVRVASPCPADWDTMIGDERIRFCGQCELKVYNLSSMTRRQAEDLIAGTEVRLCIRYFRRRDGSILTRDCPVGLARIKQRLSRLRRAVTAALLGFFAGASGSYAVNGLRTAMSEPPVMGAIAYDVREPEALPEVGKYEIGDMTPKAPIVHRKRRSRR